MSCQNEEKKHASDSDPFPEDEGETTVTTILLLFLNAAPLVENSRKPGKTQTFCMTLWGDGPAISPVKDFGGAESWILRAQLCVHS